ncbi:MAG: hypothetical protein ACXVW2_05070 [Nocardioidaceae bacterium]
MHGGRRALLGAVVLGWALTGCAATSLTVVRSRVTPAATVRPVSVPTVPVEHGQVGRPRVLPDPNGFGDLVARFRNPASAWGLWRAAAADAPRRAPSYLLTRRTGGLDVASRAARLAAALGLPGPARHRDGHLSYGDGIDVALVVDLDRGLRWGYTREGVRCTDIGPTDADSLAGCAPVAQTGDTSVAGDDTSGPRHSPVSPARARRLAAPLFAALGYDVRAAETMPGWGTTLVTVAPTIDGLPTSGLATGVVVDAKGVLAASGWLGSAAPARRYPVEPFDVAARRWTAGATGATGAGCACDQRLPTVDRVRFGLSLWTGIDGSALMVPAWVGSTAGQTGVAARLAVTPRYLPRFLRPTPAQ